MFGVLFFKSAAKPSSPLPWCSADVEHVRLSLDHACCTQLTQAPHCSCQSPAAPLTSGLPRTPLQTAISIPKQHNHTRQGELSVSAQAETCSAGCSSQPNAFKRECSRRNRLRCEAVCFPFNGHQLLKAKLFALFLAVAAVRCSVSMLCVFLCSSTHA